jgi:hypothetical protein
MIPASAKQLALDLLPGTSTVRNRFLPHIVSELCFDSCFGSFTRLRQTYDRLQMVIVVKDAIIFADVRRYFSPSSAGMYYSP